MKYNQSMAQILAEMNKVKKEQEDGGAEDPIDVAKKQIQKIKKVAILKKQMADIQKSEDTDLEEKVEYIEYKFRNSKQAVEVVRFVQAMNTGVPRNLDINDDQENKGIIVFDAGREDFTKIHKMIVKKFRPQILAVENLDKEDEPTIKKVVKGLKKASGLHKAQAKELEKDISDETDLEERMKSKPLSGQDVAKRMMKIKSMKPFASKVAKMKKVSTVDLERLLPYDKVSITDIEKMMAGKFVKEDISDETDLEEFTDKQIERLRKEYQDLKGKESGINPEKFKKLRGMMKRFPKANLLKLVKADIPVLTTGAKAALVMYHGMKWKQLPEDFLPYIELFADDNQELSEVKKGKFKEVDPKVIDRIEKLMRGSRAEKDSIANMLNYFMPPEVVDMVRYKLKIVPKRGKIKF